MKTRKQAKEYGGPYHDALKGNQMEVVVDKQLQVEELTDDNPRPSIVVFPDLLAPPVVVTGPLTIRK
jgi:hypothetical protein